MSDDYERRVEAAAKAAWEKFCKGSNGPPVPWETLPDYAKDFWKGIARAAISAFCAGAARVNVSEACWQGAVVLSSAMFFEDEDQPPLGSCIILPAAPEEEEEE